MTKVDGAISSLIQGVSQQPARERLPGQCELQENCTSDVLNGLARRGHTEYVSRLISSANTYRFTDYDGGSIGQFIIAHRAEEIKIFDTAGTEYDVVMESGDTYVPNGDLVFSGIDDQIYVVNPAVTVAMDTDVREYVDDGCIVFLLGGQYGRQYKIALTWTDSDDVTVSQTVTYSTPNGGTASDITKLATDDIAANLTTALNGNSTITADFDITRESDVIYIKKKVAADVVTYRADVGDGDGGANMFAVNNSVKDVGRLPRFAPHGYVVQVSESSNATVDDWYLEFISDAAGTAIGSGFGTTGKWIETVAPGIPYKLDVATMPHVIKKTGATEFTFSQGDWADRAVGDEKTNPMPSFVGNKITDVNVFQGRLVLLADVNAILSRATSKTDFWNQSATTLTDDDPIDVSSALGTYVLRKAVPHNRDLIIWSDRAQFIMFGRNRITPKNTSLVLTSEFDADLSASPVGAGRDIFFAYKYGAYTGISEFFTSGAEDVNDARSVVGQVQQYIRGVPEQLVSTTNFDKFGVVTDYDRKIMYWYEYTVVNDQKVQSSWSTWKFNKDILHAFFLNNLLYMVMQAGSLYELYILNLDDTPEEDVGYRVMLDEQIALTDVDTSFTVEYAVDNINNYVVVQGEGCPYPGLRAPIQGYATGTVTLKDDMGGGKVYFGRKYLSRYKPTMPFVRDRDNVKIGSGTLTVKHFTVYFSRTGYFKSVITDKYGYYAEVEYTGRIVGDPNNKVGEAIVADGSYVIPFKHNVDNSQLEIQTDSHTPMYLTELEWNGQWVKKGRRITGG